MPAWLPLVLVLAKTPTPDPALHKIDVHVAGPLAMVDVWRTVEANVRTIENRQVGTFIDLSLPAGAALLDWEIVERSKPVRLAAKSEVEANAALTAGLKLRRLATPPAADDGTDFRVHLTPLADGERALLHYRYSALAGCKDGRLVLRVPSSQEEAPVPAEVAVTFAPSPDGNRLLAVTLAGKPAELPAAARKPVVQGTVPPRPDWELTWAYAKPAVVAAALVPGVKTNGRAAHAVAQYEAAALVCRSTEAAAPRAPERVVLLVDRSRSVGQGGLSAERAVGRALIEALPPSVLFDAVLFAGTVEPVFTLPRLPTREALDAFSNRADPNRLDNGTNVVAALTAARARLGDAGGAAWVVLVTDGALPPNQTGASMQKALKGAGGPSPKLLVLVVRQHGDEDVAPNALAEYARLVAGFGGLVRVLPPGSPVETAREIVTAMGQGGDWLDVRVEETTLAAAVPPGRGASVALSTRARLPADKRLRLTARGLDAEWRADVKPSVVKREWLDPLVDRRTARPAWAGATSGMAVCVLPGPLTSKPADTVVRGRMDPGVLRNALALAFTPRARACYVSRRVAKAGDSYLRGRLKLELNLERGELQDAVIRSSTLGNPDVEACVRDAAWAVEYPRPEHRDAPTLANVNLVFSPRTGPEKSPAAGAMDKEIELILGPLTSPGDFTDLLANPDAGTAAGAQR